VTVVVVVGVGMVVDVVGGAVVLVVVLEEGLGGAASTPRGFSAAERVLGVATVSALHPEIGAESTASRTAEMRTERRLGTRVSCG
jgi:hypothetical protein